MSKTTFKQLLIPEVKCSNINFAANILVESIVGAKMSTPKNKFTLIELFAGVGGFRQASKDLGVEVVFWNQWEPGSKTQHAASVYRQNFGDEGFIDGTSQVDIAIAVKALKYPKTNESKVDLLVGGFPCQDYSVAKSKNSALGLEGKKGVLWWPMLELIDNAKPKYIFLENVDRLLKSPASQKGRDFAIMLKTLGSRGYQIEWRVIDASQYGGFQRRKRVFIIAKRLERWSIRKLNSEQAVNLITSTGILARAYQVGRLKNEMSFIELQGEPEQLTKEFGLGKKVSQFQNAGIYLNNRAYSVEVEAVSSEKATLRSALQPESEVPAEFYVEEEDLDQWRTLKKGGPKPRISKLGHSYIYSEGKMNLTDDLEKPSRTIVTGEGGSTPSRFKHLIQVQGRYRRLTPVELERLNGFPDNHTKYDLEGNEISNIKRAFFMGNALVVPVVRMALQVIVEDLRGQNGNNDKG